MSATDRIRAATAAGCLAVTALGAAATAGDGFADRQGMGCSAMVLFTPGSTSSTRAVVRGGPVYAVDLLDSDLAPAPTPGPGTGITMTCSVQLSSNPADGDIATVQETGPVDGVVAVSPREVALTTAVAPLEAVFVCTLVTWTDPDGTEQSFTADADPEDPDVDCPLADMTGWARLVPRLP